MPDPDKSRIEYQLGSLELSDCPPNPFELFASWLDEALNKSLNDQAMVLSTCDKLNRPSSRVVLLKGWDSTGFKFFTNYKSRKAEDLDANPNSAANFFWAELERQVRIEGKINKLPSKDSDFYFNSRPEESRINSIISPQSKKISSREFLTKKNEEFRRGLKSGLTTVERPDYWGGYILIPDRIEFWQGRPGRLNDRVLYSRITDGWQKCLLAP